MNGETGIAIYVGLIMTGISYVIYVGFKSSREAEQYRIEKKARKKAKKEEKRQRALASANQHVQASK